MMGKYGLTLNWFTSYLTNSTISIIIEQSYSPLSPLNHCFLTGSVLGLSQFSIYIRPIADIRTLQIYITIFLLMIFNYLPFLYNFL